MTVTQGAFLRLSLRLFGVQIKGLGRVLLMDVNLMEGAVLR